MLCINGDMFLKSIVILPALAERFLVVKRSWPSGSASSVSEEVPEPEAASRPVWVIGAIVALALEPPDVATAIETVASTGTADIAITARWAPGEPGKFGLRRPRNIDRNSAQATSRPPA